MAPGRFPTLALPRSGSRVGKVSLSTISARLPEHPCALRTTPAKLRTSPTHKFCNLYGSCQIMWQLPCLQSLRLDRVTARMRLIRFEKACFKHRNNSSVLGTTPSNPKENFARAVRCPDDEINLSSASLNAAAAEFPDLDVVAYQGLIAKLGVQVKSHLTAHHSIYDFVDVMYDVIFEEAGFKGNTKDYFDPNNNHINQVIDQKTGSPVALSILYMEVARTAGVLVDGISLRKHFVVAVGDGDDRLYVDPFYRGGLLSRKECIVSILGKD